MRSLLLTHIHLDHAGAAGTIVERVPEMKVYVHERGAPHLIDPEKLLASATRLHGDQMDTLWGAVLPVPADRIVVLQGGERLDVAGHELRVAYTPGHAKHHVSYLDEQSGMAYVGDTGGVRVSGDYLLRQRRRPTSTSKPGAPASRRSRRGSRFHCSSHISDRSRRPARTWPGSVTR